MSTRFRPNLRGMSPGFQTKDFVAQYRREVQQLEALGLGDSDACALAREFLATYEAELESAHG